MRRPVIVEGGKLVRESKAEIPREDRVVMDCEDSES